ncbi:MAG: hypothetical protein ACLQAT_19060 [Candidatus Binataceae bacterium]
MKKSMKSDSSKLSVGLVGFLQHNQDSNEPTRALVGFPANRPILTTNPTTNPTKTRAAKAAEVVEVVMRSVPESATTFLYHGATDIAPMEFPLCPRCETRRYWLGTEGKVVCSGCGTVGFQIIAMEFSTIQ